MALDTSTYGMYGDEVVAPARAIVKHPDDISWEAAVVIGGHRDLAPHFEG